VDDLNGGGKVARLSQANEGVVKAAWAQKLNNGHMALRLARDQAGDAYNR